MFLIFCGLEVPEIDSVRSWALKNKRSFFLHEEQESSERLYEGKA